MRNVFIYPVLVIVMLSISVSCTRKKADPSSSISFEVPASSGRVIQHSKVGTFAVNDLSALIVNVQIPGRSPIYRELDFHDSAPPSGTITMSIDNIPPAPGILVQALGVYETTTGLTFKYGDAAVDTSSNANVTASITLSTLGGTGGMASVAGRYVDKVTAGVATGPTGTMVAYVEPGNGKPAMALMEMSIINGWFSMFVLDGITSAFTYKLKSTGDIVFKKAYLSSGNLILLDKDGSVINTTSDTFHRLSVKSPAGYRLNYSSAESRSATSYFVGWFHSPSASFTASGKKVCYPSYDESIEKLYEDSALSNPLQYAGTAPTATEMGPYGSGGDAKTFLQLFGAISPQCNDNDSLIFLPQAADRGSIAGANHIGANIPFKSMNYLEPNGLFLKTSYSSNMINADWKLMPDMLITGVVDGFTVYAKRNSTSTTSSSNSGGGEQPPCDLYASQKLYANVGDLANSITTYQFGANEATAVANAHPASAVGYSTWSESEKYYWKFLVCPYRTKSDGQREYYISKAESQCFGSCSNINYTGNSPTDVTIANSVQAGTTFSDTKYKRITAITVQSDHLNLGASGLTANEFTGKEIMVIKMSEAGTGCGANTGDAIFTTVLENTGSEVKIPLGTVLDGMTAAPLAAAWADSNKCFLQLVTVAQFKNLNINSGGSITVPQYNSATTGEGGVLAIRVSGVLTLDGIISANGGGYLGGSAGSNGAGYSSSPLSGGTHHSSGGGGGAGYGDGSYGYSNAIYGGIGWGVAGMQPYIFTRMGAGGGTGGSSSNGGGVIFIAANKLMISSASTISSNGSNGTTYGGGGGGGSITLYANSATGLSNLTVSANGGTGNGGGGGGGGGAISSFICSMTGTPTLAADKGSGSTCDGGDANCAGYAELFTTGDAEAHSCGSL